MAALAATQGWQEVAARAGAKQPGRASGEAALVTSQPFPILHSRGVARYGRAEEGAMAKVDASSSLRTMEIWLLPFAAMFTQPSWLNAVALATGALLCLNRRTVCAALRAVDGSADKGFSRFHRFLSRAEWSGLQGARIRLGQLQKVFVPEGEPLVIALDDSVERRPGAKIRDKGIWRDAVRSSRGFFVKVAGLRWLSLQVVVRPGFAKRTWGLPFLTILSRSEQVDVRRQRRHQTLPEKAIWAMRLVARWCPGRCLVMVADGAYARVYGQSQPSLARKLSRRMLRIAQARWMKPR